ncbi:kinase-like protein [Thelephora ganbajun]|uniref:Kinase-like protein n=1 Tax=Thelephora ganbajun TaxID=370292 RepID=A0ACB6ZFA4_THEGA|nr:kinase-like protein [Thelephora ganbajun]
MGTGENLTQAPFKYPQRTGLSVASSSSASEILLYGCHHVAGISMDERVLNIRAFLHSPHRIAAARGLRGEEAQGLIELIDQAVTLSELDQKLRKQCLHLLYKVCKACETLPASYILRQEVLDVGGVCCYGGFADVREGEYLGRRVAIKCLRYGSKGAIGKTFKRFCREVIAWKRLSHDNILPLLGVFVSTNPLRSLIVSSWMRNGNVMEYTRGNPELSEVMSGATYLHELGVAHGDLKGANILVDDNGTARLADFGLMAILIDLSTIPLSATTVSSVGTVCWMSPELLFGQNSPRTCQSDCYALGMVIYEVLTGLRPFHNLSPFAVVVAVQKGGRPRKPPNARSLGLSDKLWELVLRCWNKSSSARPTARQLFRCLEDSSRTWIPPPEYPILDDFDGGEGIDLTSDDEWSIATGALESGLFALMVGMLCVLLLLFT